MRGGQKTPALAVDDDKILTIRGHKVMLDLDLSPLYGVTTKAFNQAVKRNRGRFPADFMFRLNVEEFRQVEILRSQSVTPRISGTPRRDFSWPLC